MPVDGLETYLAISDLERGCGRARRRLDELVRLLGLRGPARILDAGAGQGWYSLPLARRHEVLGIDTSERLIAEARGRAAHLPTGRAPRLIVAPSQAVPAPDGAFDLALSLSGSIGYGSRDDDRATLAELRRVLAPDGRLVLEVPQGEAVARLSDYVEAFACGDLVVHEPRVDQRLQLLRETQTLLRRSAELQPFAYAMQLYDVSELEALLDEAGLSPIGRFGGTDGSRLSASSQVLLVARPARSPAAAAAPLRAGQPGRVPVPPSSR
jgi:D-alanine-D-alanine ligase